MLAIVNEVYFRNTAPQPDFEEGRAAPASQDRSMRQRPADDRIRIADYGSRRRFSRPGTRRCCARLQVAGRRARSFAGTQQRPLRDGQGLTPLGTMAHEYLQACQAVGPRLRDSQTFAFEMWAQRVSRRPGHRAVRRLGLTRSCATSTCFSASCSTACATIQRRPVRVGRAADRALRREPHRPAHQDDGVLRPSTSPLRHRPLRALQGPRQHRFGIGTNLTNDLGYEPLQIVIKMTRCNGQPVAKLRDTPSKNMCDDEAYIRYLRQVFEIKAPAP